MSDGDLRVLEMVATWAAMREDLDRLRVVWRAVVEEITIAAYDLPDAIRTAVITTGLATEDEEDETRPHNYVLTPDGERLARGGA